MIGGPVTLSTGAQRLAGYRESLLEAGVRYDPRWAVSYTHLTLPTSDLV